ncbi:predicted protein [Postia placenta Mad-698-R]|uniref:Uncharacterized protein n=2 Tax=Rhodonia placenta TaxID=104341 RepID=A0A1X6MSK4_9APHY|nr:hypothetical protein POSPLADRAFT_1048509 [Postia placenta MAD-698-R-SB12]EED84458.1 predicted protein [Postia placenta Mad-698-R]KAF9821495.1 hypothetical protein IEO21_00741 [Postia placenta]OSX59153.1 hypothetical protein POSPLADRAFT_1048509 [Postia placenta MAD-698-R-SB12]
MNLEHPDHDDFEVVSQDSRFGGFEVLKHKERSLASFSQKAHSPRRMELQKHVMADKVFGTVYPVYTRDGRKWILMCRTRIYTRGSFTGPGVRGHYLHLPKHHRKASREALGIWKVDGRAWKVYEKDGQYQKLMDDYLRAEVDAGLPMGKFSFLKGTVKRSKAPTNGFVLETEWMEGANFQKGSFKQALERGEIPHEKATDDYGRTKGGCDAANVVGLKDCQGFVKAGIREPLRFIDVHTSWNQRTKKFDHSEEAQALVDVIDTWGTK